MHVNGRGHPRRSRIDAEKDCLLEKLRRCGRSTVFRSRTCFSCFWLRSIRQNTTLSLALLATLAVADPTVYLIRHGEKPDSGNGLSSQGEERAQCLVNVFGSSSSYDIGYILAEKPKSDGKRARPLDTVTPLANALGLTVDTSCDKTDADCVAKAVSNWSGDGNILICWEHGELTDIAEALGDKNAPTYDDDSFNIIWTMPPPYDDVTAQTSEDCPGLDSN